MLSGIAFVLRKAPRTALALGVAVAVACPAVLVGDALPVGRNALGAVSVGAPTDLRVVPGNGTVTVAFTRPVLPTGVAVLDVAASFAPAGTSTWTAWRTPIVADPIAPVTFGGLTNGVALRMRVRLVTSVGAGAPGYVGTAFTPQAPLEIYVATDGRDTAPGTRAAPLRTIAAAWSRIPRGTTLSRPHTIVVFPGEYAASTMPHYWEWRRGTATAPITLRAEGTGRPVTLRGDLNLFEVHHLRVRGIRIAPGGDAVHCERCSFLTLDNVELDGGGSAWETLKVNQSSDITVRNSTLRGAGDNVIDFVAVQRGAIVGNVISGAGDWCAYVKGGSTRITVAGNEISHCGTGGFTAGQGTGLEFTVAPWTTYEATDIVFRGNHITDTEGAAFGVNGGRNIVFENNRAERVGRRSHLVEVTFGGRSCDGDRTRCTALLASGAWGTDVVGGDVYAHIPDRNVVIRGNTIVNPAGYSSQWQHFEVSSPRANGGVRVGPSPARTDDGLVITGNVIRNGPASMPLGIDGETVCAPTNPTCTIAVIYRDNDINGR